MISSNTSWLRWTTGLVSFLSNYVISDDVLRNDEIIIISVQTPMCSMGVSGTLLREPFLKYSVSKGNILLIRNIHD